MITFLHDLRARLDAVHPGGFNAALALLIFAALWAVRRFKPAFFAALPAAWQAWPALVSGAVIGAITSGGDVIATLAGLVSGVLAVGVHRVAKESPLPYGSASGSAKGPLAAGILFLVLVVSCASQLSQAQCRAASAKGADVARAMCVAYHSQKHPESGLAEVADTFCRTPAQLEAFSDAACDVAAAVDAPPADAGTE